MIRITNQYVWNVIFGIFFLTLFVMGVIILESEAYLTRETITVLDIAIIILATYRMIRLFLYDTITKFFREQFYDVEVKRGGKMQFVRPLSGPRRTICDLLSCPWCFGLWAGSTIVFFYMLTPLAYFPVLVLAISGFASQLSVMSHYFFSKPE